MGKSFYGLCSTILGMLFTDYSDYGLSGPRLLLAFLLLALQLVLFAVVLCPLALFYLFGLLITTGISLWRLIERDYGKSDGGGGGGANLEPALNVLYALVLFQGVLFCYRFASRFPGKRLAGLVAVSYGFRDRKEMVIEYLRETKTGCEKDPSFAKGRNLVTFAVALIRPESSSSEYKSGAMILDKILEQKELQEQHALIRKLVGSPSSRKVMKKLLRSLRSSSQYNREVRVLAARIVAHLADEISLVSFPDGLGCISSLLDTTITEHQDDDGAGAAPSSHYKELMVQGLLILDKLAADEHNRRVISTEDGLLSRAMAAISADLLHRIDHDTWSDVTAASLQFMCRLVTAPGETGAKLRSDIFKNKDAISTMEKILKCDKCSEELHILVIKILTVLPMDASSSMTTESREKFTKLLVDIFTDENKDSSIRQMGGEALAMLSDQSESNAAIIFKESDTVVKDLTTMILDASKNRGYRISAAQILEHLYIRYKKDDDYLKKITEAMKDVLPEVLKEIFLFPTDQGEMQTETTEKETEGAKFSTPNPDIERGQDAVGSQDDVSVNEQNDDANEQNVNRKLHAVLLSLSAAIFEKVIKDGNDLVQLVGTIAPGDSASSFASKLKNMVEGNSGARANCLRILKITSRMIIQLIKLDGLYIEGELESLLNSLSNASRKMLELEGLMMFSSSDPSKMKPISSLVEEAQGLLEEKKRQVQNLATTPVP